MYRQIKILCAYPSMCTCAWYYNNEASLRIFFRDRVFFAAINRVNGVGSRGKKGSPLGPPGLPAVICAMTALGQFVEARVELLELNVRSGLATASPAYLKLQSDACAAINRQIAMVGRVGVAEITSILSLICNGTFTADQISSMRNNMILRLDQNVSASMNTKCSSVANVTAWPTQELWTLILSDADVNVKVQAVSTLFGRGGLKNPTEIAARDITGLAMLQATDEYIRTHGLYHVRNAKMVMKSSAEALSEQHGPCPFEFESPDEFKQKYPIWAHSMYDGKEATPMAPDVRLRYAFVIKQLGCRSTKHVRNASPGACSSQIVPFNSSSQSMGCPQVWPSMGGMPPHLAQALGQLVQSIRPEEPKITYFGQSPPAAGMVTPQRSGSNLSPDPPSSSLVAEPPTPQDALGLNDVIEAANASDKKGLKKKPAAASDFANTDSDDCSEASSSKSKARGKSKKAKGKAAPKSMKKAAPKSKKKSAKKSKEKAAPEILPKPSSLGFPGKAKRPPMMYGKSVIYFSPKRFRLMRKRGDRVDVAFNYGATRTAREAWTELRKEVLRINK